MVNPIPGLPRGSPCLHQIVLVHKNAFAIGAVSRAMRRRVMLMARMLRIEAPITDLALPFFDDAVGRTVLDVLVVCFPVGKGTVARVAVGHSE